MAPKTDGLIIVWGWLPNLFSKNSWEGRHLYRLIITLILCAQCAAAHANSEDKSLTAYFFNDSVNGFQFSDAYETHNMGLKLETETDFYQIDLGIVTPDMFEYENEFRTANRSFGELVSFVYGRNLSNLATVDIQMWAKLTSQGDFGISGLQSILHQFADFQDDIELLELVRMPSKIWVGLGTNTTIKTDKLQNDYKLGLLSYVGTDRVSFQPYVEVEKGIRSWQAFGRLAFEYVPYDNIISAPPIQAKVREFRPLLGVGLSREFGPLTITISENISLPSISSDKKVYARLFMGASMSLDSLSKLFVND